MEVLEFRASRNEYEKHLAYQLQFRLDTPYVCSTRLLRVS